jgi:hypothetical protein
MAERTDAHIVEVSDRQGGVWPSQRGLGNPRLALSRRPEENAPGRNRRLPADTGPAGDPRITRAIEVLADEAQLLDDRGRRTQSLCRSTTFAEVVADLLRTVGPRIATAFAGAARSFQVLCRPSIMLRPSG